MMGIVTSLPAAGEDAARSFEQYEHSELAVVSRLSMEDRSSGCISSGSGNVVGVSLSIALVLDRLELFQTPAFALFGRGVAIDVSLAAVLGLHRVL
eukprot:814328-Pleurochrysis_carterae.AAC.1